MSPNVVFGDEITVQALITENLYRLGCNSGVSNYHEVQCDQIPNKDGTPVTPDDVNESE